MRTFTITLAAWAALTLAAPTAPARAAEGATEPEFTLRIGTAAPSGTPWSALLARAKTRIEKETGGRVKVKLYLGSKLGSEGSLVRRCQKGQVGGIAVSNGALGQAVSELYATELPYLFAKEEEAYRALDASVPLVTELLAAKGFVFYMWGENGYRHFASSERRIVTPADMKGLKMRSQPAMPHVAMYEALGAGASTIPVAEVTSSLGSGVVTGYDNTLLYAFATAWHEKVKYVTLSAHIYQPAVVVWCKPWFDTLPDDLKAVLLRVPDGEVDYGRTAVRAMNKRLEDVYRKAGLEIIALKDAQKAAFKAATASVREKFLADAAKDRTRGRELLELLERNR